MASICLMCAKHSQNGGRYSNRTRATKFQPVPGRFGAGVRRYPNLQWARVPQGPRIKICTRCIKAGKHLQLAPLVA